MLCGAEDTDIIKDPFVNVVTGFGGNALSYLLGNIEYENTSQASFTKNSIDTVKKANLCVFVIKQPKVHYRVYYQLYSHIFFYIILITH